MKIIETRTWDVVLPEEPDLKATIERYETALRWYADWLNYHRDYSTGKDKSLAEYDEGARARAALGEKR